MKENWVDDGGDRVKKVQMNMIIIHWFWSRVQLIYTDTYDGLVYVFRLVFVSNGILMKTE